MIGGGIGGLAAAIGLDAVGFDVEVYEQAQELREVGAGLVVWRNGLEALEVLGGHEAVVRAGGSIALNAFKTPAGSVLSKVNAQDLLPTHTDIPVRVVLHRADLQRVLRDRVGAGVIHLDHECIGVAADGEQVRARFSGGDVVHGDLLVEADGIHSAVRSSLHGGAEPRFSGVGICRAVTRFDHPISTGETIVQPLGTGKRFVVLPMGDGRVYWVVTMRPQPGSESPGTASNERLTRIFGEWHEPIPALVEATPEAALIWDEAADRRLLDEWGRGRLTPLGDAAHLALPFVGQGASQALEDVVWLNRHLDREPDPATALRAYEAQRQDRTSMIVRTGRRLARIWHLRDPLVVAARNVLTKNGPDRLFGRAFQRNVMTDL